MNYVIYPLSSADISIFLSENQQFLFYREIQINITFYYIFLITILLAFIES